MKKEMMFMCAALLSGVVCAEEQLDSEKLEQLKNDVRTITYTFSVSRGENCDEKAWSEAIEFAGRAAEVAIASENGEASNDEMIDATLRAVKESYEQCAGADGINGNLRIWIDDRNLEDSNLEEAPETSDLRVEGEKDDTKGCDGVCGGDDDK